MTKNYKNTNQDIQLENIIHKFTPKGRKMYAVTEYRFFMDENEAYSHAVFSNRKDAQVYVNNILKQCEKEIEGCEISNYYDGFTIEIEHSYLTTSFKIQEVNVIY